MAYSNRHLIGLLLVLLSLQIVGCTTPKVSSDTVEAAQVEAIEGTELNRIQLTERAIERIQLRTAVVREELINGETRKVIPYSALIYDVNGGVWLYRNTQPLTFVRETITVDYIQDDLAVLIDGPAAGAEVVTVGAAELYGVDSGVGQ